MQLLPSARIAYADPPYPGQAHLYKDHPDFGGEVDHAELLNQLVSYDGFILHTSSPALGHIIDCARNAGLEDNDYRIVAWVKQWASWKPGTRLQYAWEPVLVKPARPPRERADAQNGQSSIRDWMMERMAMRKGLAGAKPNSVSQWLFTCVGAEPTDTLHDMFPGTGAVTEAWNSWIKSCQEEPEQLKLQNITSEH